NHFVFNLFDADLTRFNAWMAEHEAMPQPLYPVVRGRLTEINGTPVRDAVTKENEDAQRALNRDLVLTEVTETTLPESNRVTDGDWPPQPGTVSVERELAVNLGLQRG